MVALDVKGSNFLFKHMLVFWLIKRLSVFSPFFCVIVFNIIVAGVPEDLFKIFAAGVSEDLL